MKYDTTDEDRSYAHIFSGGNAIHMTGHCMYCNHCPFGVKIRANMKKARQVFVPPK